VQVNEIDLTVYGLELPEDLNFIRDCILGPPRDKRKSKTRTDDKEFLHDIVNNTRSGFDVDKMDYFLRDSRHCAPDRAPTWTTEKIFDCARVMRARATPLQGESPDDNPTQICFPITCVKDASRWFETRSDLHQSVYTHSVVKAAELMICDVLSLVRDIPLLFLKDDDKYTRITVADAAWKPQYMEHMTDNILAQIKNLGDAGLSDEQRVRYFKALELLERLHRRDMYRCVGCCTLPEDMREGDGKRSVVPKAKIDEHRKQILDGILEEAAKIVAAEAEEGNGANGAEAMECDSEVEEGTAMPNGSANGNGIASAAAGGEGVGLGPEDVWVEITNIHWGQGMRNPVDSMRFYDSQYKDKDKRRDALGMKPKLEHYGFTFQTYQQNRIRVFCKTRAKAGLVARAMRAWWDAHHRPEGKASSDDTQHDFEHPQDDHEVFGSHAEDLKVYREDEDEEEASPPLHEHEQGDGAT
jgi:hypothetical protein